MPVPDGATLTWALDPGLCGLYVLHVDGHPVADTSLVDPELPRAQKIDALAGVDWLPPQQMSAEYNRIVSASEIRPMGRPLPDDRRISPCHGGFAATMDTDADPSQHPVGRYLFPDVDRSGELAVETGETIIMQWKSFVPMLKARRDSDGKDLSASTHVPTSSETRHWRGILTNRRLVYMAALHVPLAVREDYPSIFVPTALFEGVATYRQIKRWVTRPNLHWGFHVRHEWASEIACGHISDRKKPRFSRYDDTMFIQSAFHYPAGTASGIFRIPVKAVEPPLREIGDAYALAVQANEAERRAAPPQAHDVVIPRGFGKKETESTTVWAIDGACSWSLPASVLSS